MYYIRNQHGAYARCYAVDVEWYDDKKEAHPFSSRETAQFVLDIYRKMLYNVDNWRIERE